MTQSYIYIYVHVGSTALSLLVRADLQGYEVSSTVFRVQVRLEERDEFYDLVRTCPELLITKPMEKRFQTVFQMLPRDVQSNMITLTAFALIAKNDHASYALVVSLICCKPCETFGLGVALS